MVGEEEDTSPSRTPTDTPAIVGRQSDRLSLLFCCSALVQRRAVDGLARTIER